MSNTVENVKSSQDLEVCISHRTCTWLCGCVCVCMLCACVCLVCVCVCDVYVFVHVYVFVCSVFVQGVCIKYDE